MEFQKLRSPRQQSQTTMATLWSFVLCGFLTALTGCSATPTSTHLPQSARTAFGYYLTQYNFKAFAVDLKTGAYGWQAGYLWPESAVERAMQRCGKHGSSCQLFAIGNRIVANLPDEQVATIKEEYFSRTVAPPKIDERGKILSSEEIRVYFSGKTLKEKTNTGRQLITTFFSNGQISAQVVDTGIEDTGTWYIEGDKLCRQLRTFTLGKLDCQQVVKDGNSFRFYSEGKYVSEAVVFSTK